MGLFYDSLTMALACNRSIFPTGDFNIDVIRDHAFDDKQEDQDVDPDSSDIDPK